MQAKWWGTALALVVTLSAGVALGQGAASVIEARQKGYKAQGAAFKTINDELKKGSPDLAAIRVSSKVLADTAVNQFNWFPKGSGPEAGVKTAAKAEIWAKPAEFAAAQKTFAGEAANLARGAAGNDVAAIRAHVQAVGKTCAGCHNQFREKK